MESRRKRSRGQIVKWICYALLGLLCAVLQTTPGLFQFGAAKPLWLLPLALSVAVFEGEFAGSRRRRHCKKERQLFVNLKHPAHFSDRKISPYCARSRDLGAVYDRAASDGKDRLTAGYKKTFRCRIHLRHGRIRRYTCV